MKRPQALLWPATAFFWALTYLIDSVGERDWLAVGLASVGCLMAISTIALLLLERSTDGAL